jgi:hypothetical protein
MKDFNVQEFLAKKSFGTNGFFPIVFGRAADGKQLTGIWTLTSAAQTFIYRNDFARGKSPSLTIVQP